MLCDAREKSYLYINSIFIFAHNHICIYIIQKSHSKPKNNYEEYVTGMMMESNANVQYAIV